MRWGLFLVLCFLPACETPTVPGYVSGTWRQVGVTFDVDITFIVDRYTVTHVRLTPGEFAIAPWPCPGTTLIQQSLNHAIVDDRFSFAITQGGVTANVAGRFQGFGGGIDARGTVRLTGAGCVDVLPIDWTASRPLAE